MLALIIPAPCAKPIDFNFSSSDPLRRTHSPFIPMSKNLSSRRSPKILNGRAWSMSHKEVRSERSRLAMMRSPTDDILTTPHGARGAFTHIRLSLRRSGICNSMAWNTCWRTPGYAEHRDSEVWLRYCSYIQNQQKSILIGEWRVVDNGYFGIT